MESPITLISPETIFDINYPVGSMYTASTPVPPQIGEWVFYDKFYKRLSWNSSSTPDAGIVESVNSGITINNWYVRILDHNIMVRISYSNTIELNDTSTELFKINTEKIGTTHFITGYYGIMVPSDPYQSIGILNYIYSSNTFNHIDVINADHTAVPAGATFFLTYTFLTQYNLMSNDFCDRFVFRRVS